jgi:hypothetical protein
VVSKFDELTATEMTYLPIPLGQSSANTDIEWTIACVSRDSKFCEHAQGTFCSKATACPYLLDLDDTATVAWSTEYIAKLTCNLYDHLQMYVIQVETYVTTLSGNRFQVLTSFWRLY